MIVTGELLRCPVCRGIDVFELPFGYRFKERWIGGFECRSCGMIFIHPQPTSAEIEELYSVEYFDGGDYRCGHAGSYFDQQAMDGLVDRPLLDRIREIVIGGRFLEIGCAGGAFLRAARDVGYEVYGVELSREMAAFANEKFGLDVWAGDVIDARYPSAHFDVVFMGDVLEHLPDPVRILREIHRIVREGGLLAILCPMQTNTLFSRLGFSVYGILGRKAVVHLPPYHLFEYRPWSLTRMISQQGFRIIRQTESAIRPSDIVLRGSFLQRVMKKALQYPNFLLTRALNSFGDRIELFALKNTA